MLGDIGTHADHLLRYVVGRPITHLSADLGAVVPGRAVHDWCACLLRMEGGLRGTLTVSQALAGEGKPFGIRVFAVAPGAVDTKLLRSNFPDYPADQALAPDDVAAVIESACDPRLAPASGQTLFVRK